jgi:hypothetical protein
MVALICITIIGSAAIFTSAVITGQMKEEYRALLNAAYQDMKDNQRKVFVAVIEINSGDIITKDMIEEKTVYSSQLQETYITKKGIGMTALIDIPAGTQIVRAMLTEDSISDELRETQYQVINVNSNIACNDTVDIRICYPNGESYVVLSKKIIRGYSAETATCFFWNDEEEILRMSAAIVDAGLYQGSKLITTKYIEPRIQNASEVNYVPSLQVLSLIESNPNIVVRCSQELNKTVRKSLENRLAASIGADVATADWNVSDYEFKAAKEVSPTDNKEGKILSVTPTVTPETGDLGASDTAIENAELGDSQTKDYLYYVKEGEIEYGE